MQSDSHKNDARRCAGSLHKHWNS